MYTQFLMKVTWMMHYFQVQELLGVEAEMRHAPDGRETSFAEDEPRAGPDYIKILLECQHSLYEQCTYIPVNR